MSTWSDNYSNHVFHNNWQIFKQGVASIDVTSITDVNILNSIARLKKVISFVDSYLSLVDPEINGTSVLDQLNQQIMQGDTHIKQYNQNKNVTLIDAINRILDNCLPYIKTLNILLPEISQTSISDMLQSYNETISRALNEINLPSVKKASNAIKQLRDELFDGENSTKSKIMEEFSGVQEKHLQIKKFYNEMLEDSNNDISIKTKITTSKNQILKDIDDITSRINGAASEIDDLGVFYEQVYGKLDDSKKRRIGGLKEKVEQYLEEMGRLVNTHEIQYEALEKEIQSLLPGATSVGLAKAYAEERKNFKTPICWWNGCFIAALVVMAVLSFYELWNLKDIRDIGNHLLHSLPVTLPLIWLAIYASKRRSENQRLEQEYAHKEALAKSYSSYKQQIDELSQPNPQLLLKLLDCAIDTISHNASNTLDKKHGDGTVLQEALKNILELKATEMKK